MSKISVIFLVMLLPFNTFATNCSFNYSTNECMSYNGCGIIGDPDGMNGLNCQQCDPGYFNNYNQNSQSCIDCTNYFDTMNTGQELDNTMFDYGQSECPWKCTNNWYQSGDNCIHCPSTSTTDGAGSLSIDDCKCDSGEYMGGGVCRTCPANTTTGCQRGTTANDIQCQPGYTKNVSSDGVVTCTQCPPNSTLNGTNCECNIGYYANGNICTQCPFGTTTVATGATSITNCQMNNTTRFCDANGENCMNLIPSGITINAQ